VSEDALLALHLSLHYYKCDCIGFVFMCSHLLIHALYFLWMDFHPYLYIYTGLYLHLKVFHFHQLGNETLNLTILPGVLVMVGSLWPMQTTRGFLKFYFIFNGTTLPRTHVPREMISKRSSKGRREIFNWDLLNCWDSNSQCMKKIFIVPTNKPMGYYYK
jgi:hypothetical protein